MTGLSTIESAAWGLSLALQCALLGVVFYRRSYRSFPLFAAYLGATVLQSIAQFAIYKIWGFRSHRTRDISWSLEGVVIVLRSLAVLEVCRLVFQGYRGIWVVISRSLALLFVLVAGGGMLFGTQSVGLRILSADRALGLALASAVVGLFLLARYYQVQPHEPMRALALGFFLYSCFAMLNDTILKTLLHSYAPLWSFLSVLAFIGSLLVWSWALRQSYSPVVFAPKLLPTGVYHTLSPEINLRLRTLNERLSRFAGQAAERP